MARTREQLKAMFAKKNKIKIFDNEGESLDRFTVVIGKNVFGLSEKPNSQFGFNQFAFTIGKGEGFHQLSDEVLKQKKVKFVSLPIEVQKAIRDRI